MLKKTKKSLKKQKVITGNCKKMLFNWKVLHFDAECLLFDNSFHPLCGRLVAKGKKVLARIDEHDRNKRMLDGVPFWRAKQPIIQTIFPAGS